MFPAPVGSQRIFLTIHSEIATLPLSFPLLREASFKIGFPDEMIRAALGARKGVMNHAPTASHDPSRDCEITLALVRGRVKGNIVTRQASCKAWSAKGHSAGDWDTAWPPAIVACMVARGEIQQRGVFAPEAVVPLDSFLERLRHVGFSFACR